MLFKESPEVLLNVWKLPTQWAVADLVLGVTKLGPGPRLGSCYPWELKFKINFGALVGHHNLFDRRVNKTDFLYYSTTNENGGWTEGNCVNSNGEATDDYYNHNYILATTDRNVKTRWDDEQSNLVILPEEKKSC